MILTSVILLVLAVVLYHIPLYFFRFVRQKLLIRQTAVADLHSLGESRPNGQKLPGTALVCGGRQVYIMNVEITYTTFILALPVW
jgi:hypothetical protein